MSLDPTLVQSYYIYEYTFLDDLQFIRRPKDVFEYEDEDDVDAMVDAISARFIESGWEGDGAIGILWLPPFADVGIEDTWGTYVWHVKQSNNGISFLSSRCPLEFNRIEERNRTWPPENGKPINIIQTSVECLLNRVQNLVEQLTASIRAVETLTDKKVIDSTTEQLLAHYQGLMVRSHVEFLDDCYLNFLDEVINNGNRSNLTIRKTTVKVDPNRYVPDDDPDYPIGNDGAQWLTVQGLLSDIWKSFKFEPYKQRLQLLFGSVQYSIDDATRSELVKHVILRNCIQHHEGRLDKDSLRQCGMEKLTLKNGEGQYNLKAWDEIRFTEEELMSFATTLKTLGIEFSKYIDTRVPERHYLVTHDKAESE